MIAYVVLKSAESPDQAQFIGMLVICGVVLIGFISAICVPLINNTKTMTELTIKMSQLIDRMDKQDRNFEKHMQEFEEYKDHVRQSQRRQWNEIDKHHDKLMEHDAEIKQLKGE